MESRPDTKTGWPFRGNPDLYWLIGWPFRGNPDLTTAELLRPRSPTQPSPIRGLEAASVLLYCVPTGVITVSGGYPIVSPKARDANRALSTPRARRAAPHLSNCSATKWFPRTAPSLTRDAGPQGMLTVPNSKIYHLERQRVARSFFWPAHREVSQVLSHRRAVRACDHARMCQGHEHASLRTYAPDHTHTHTPTHTC